MPTLQSISPILPVRDMQASVAFYQRLGFRHEPYEDGASYAFLEMQGLWLHLTHFSNPEFVFNPCSVYFYLDDVDNFYGNVIAAGIPTLNAPADMPWEVREFAISDPDETLLRFGQLLRKA